MAAVRVQEKRIAGHQVRDYPYWRDQTPLRAVGEDGPLPEKVDVVVIGAGYSGLSTALHLARAGRDVVVIDQDRPGEHASTQNFGACGRTIRHKFTTVGKKIGLQNTIRVFNEAQAWLDYTADFVSREGIDCDLARNGRVYGCHTPEAYEALARDLDTHQKHMPVDSVMVPRAAQHKEVYSDAFFGAYVLRDVGLLNPGKYFAGLLDLALAAGVRVYGRCRAEGFEHGGEGHVVTTPRGAIWAKELVLCTNAVTGKHHPLLRHFRRRIIPIHSWTLVTEPLDEAVIRAAMPSGRMQLETILLYTGIRAIQPDGRVLITARHLFDHPSADSAARAVIAQAAERMPMLAKVRADYCWNAIFTLTFDWLPHLGRDPKTGVHYLLGLVGTGVPSCGYFGWKLANRILGNEAEGETVFADRPFPTRPFYSGNPGLALPVMREYHRRRDNGAWRRALAKHGRQPAPVSAG